MAAPESTFIYKIVPSSPPVPITSSGLLPKDYLLPASDLDKKSGFMHMSTSAQIPNTLKYFFPASQSTKNLVYLFKVPYKPYEDKKLLRWEDPEGKICGARNGEGMFPHIYDDGKFKLSHEDVESVAEVVSEFGEEDWEAALARLRGNGWLA